jgi:septum formation protein
MILASKSPRRLEILQNFGIERIKVEVATIEEISDKEDIIDQIIEIAQKKGREIAKKYPAEYILSADTVVILDGKLLGKPKDEIEAFNMLKSLSNRTHQVVTAYSLINEEKNINIFGYDRTIVTFKKLTDEDIRWYIATKEPMDKAGSYGIQGVGAGILIDKIEGEFYNVMGFPISKFVSDLQEKNIKIQDIIEF